MTAGKISLERQYPIEYYMEKLGGDNPVAKTAYLHDDIYMDHLTGYGHPERPERLSAIEKKLEAAPYYIGLIHLGPALPDMKYIEMVHAKSYIQRIRKEIESGREHIDSMDTAVCEASFDVALRAVGGSLKLCDLIMKGDALKGFCAVRPPGHHAEENYAAGFCLFNNIAIAARYLQRKHGIKKIAIVDWDVHHGNGTQHSFEEDDTIYYISTHQYPHYPGTGSPQEKGKGKGEGYTLNIPMRAGSGDAEYRDAFEKKIVPEIDRFRPEMILVSAGFDAHVSDPLSSIRLSTGMFHEFTKTLMACADRHCGGKIIAFLEGGYNLSALADSVERVMAAFVEG